MSEARASVESPAASRQRFGPWRRELRSFDELFALCGIAIVQPLLSVLSKNTGVFITRGTTGFEAVSLVVLVAVVPPAAAWMIEVAIGIMWPWARGWVHAVLVAIIVGIIAVEVVKKATSLGPRSLVLIAIAIGIAGGLLLMRFDILRQFVRYLVFAVPVFALLFLGASPVTDVVFNRDPSSTANVGFKTPHRVVLVVMDEFPEMSLLDGTGHVDRQLFPNFVAFSHESTWYRNETTVAPYTELAVPAILTGQYPKRASALPDATDYPQNLFTLLGKAFTMNVHEAVTRLCPERVCANSSAGGFGSLVSQSAELWRQFASPERKAFSFNEVEGTKTAMGTAEQFIASLHPGRRPELDFVHIELPHQPWHYVSTLQDTQATGPIQGAKYFSWTDAASAQIARQRHLLQVQASDTILGQIIAKLKAVGAYDDSMVVVTADHGIAFSNGEPLRSVSEKNYPQIMWPPLFIKYPGQHGGTVDDRPAQSVDILPTIAGVLGTTLPGHVDGRSLLGVPRPEGPRPMYQLSQYAFAPPNALKPPPGKLFLDFDGAKGFAAVLRARAVPPGPDPGLRIYRDTSYGDLVGQEAAPLVHDVPGDAKAALSSRPVFDNVQPEAHDIPWAYGEGFFNHLDASGPIAISLNGRIAAVATARLLNTKGDAFFNYIVPPELVRAGKNVPEVYIIRGTPGDPTLDPVSLHA